MFKTSTQILKGAFIASSILLAFAAQAFPTKPLKIVAALGPGSATDTIARAIGEAMSASLGVAVVVENREGAGGAVGSRFVANAAPDGYTLLMAGVTHVTVAPYLISPPPFNAVKDFTPIAKIATVPLVLIAPANSRFANLKDLVRYAKENPGKVNYATSGSGSPSYLAMELLKRSESISLTEVPYKSAGQAMSDTIAGQVELFYPAYSQAVPQVKGGKVKALAIGALERSREIPDVPTTSEVLGRADIDVRPWSGLLAPFGTPPDVVAKLAREAEKAVNSKVFQERMAASGVVITYASPTEFGAEVAADDARFRKLVMEQIRSAR